MKKLLVILLLLITMSGYSQIWNTTRQTDLDKKIYVTTELGYEIYVNGEGESRPSFDIIVMTNPEDMFTFGVGTGIRYYNQDFILLPIYGEVRAYPFTYRKNLLPFMSVKLGYSFNTADSFESVGIFTMPSIGISFENWHKQYYSLSVGYTMQSITNLHPPNDVSGAIAIIFVVTF